MARLALLLAGMLVVGSCSSGADHNDADVAFATDMISHHAQAIQMANFTIGRSVVDPRIAKLAEDIRVAQTKEIDTLSEWLRDWDEPVPETGFATGDAHTHEDSGTDEGERDLPGMMTEDEMSRLATAGGEDFGPLWLQRMIEHHEGAVSMAGEVEQDGENAAVRELAAETRTAQGGEIEDMRSWLDES